MSTTPKHISPLFNACCVAMLATAPKEEGVDLLLIGAYSTLDGVRNNLTGNKFSFGGDNWWLDVIADDAHKGSTDGDQIELFDLEVFNWTSNNPYILGR